MPGRMNRFGALPTDVVRSFSVGGYVPTIEEFGGPESVDAALDSTVDQLIQMMPEDMFLSLQDVELELVEKCAAEGQTDVAVKLFPLIAGKTHVWSGQPRAFRTKPVLKTDIEDIVLSADEYGTEVEMEDTAFTVNDETGAISFAVGYELEKRDVVYVSYSVDTDRLEVPSLALLCAQGTAGAIGAKLYPVQSAQWQLVDQLNDLFTSRLRALRDGEWIPPELRLMRFWKELTPKADSDSTMSSVRIRRA